MRWLDDLTYVALHLAIGLIMVLLCYFRNMDHDLPQQPGSSSSSGSSESSNGQRRIVKMFNVSEAQVLLDSIPTDYGTCTDEEPDSDPDDPDFTPLPNPLPSQTRIDRLTVAAEAEDCGTAGDDEENCRPSGRSVLLTKEFRTFQRMKVITCLICSGLFKE